MTNLRYDEKARGVEITIDGLEPLLEENPDLRYAVAGGGRALSRLQKWVTDSTYEDQIDILGYCEDIPTLLSRTDLFVYVSFLDSLSMTVLEAQAAGVPVIAGGAAGVPEAAGTAGYICPPTAEGVQHAVGELLTDPESRLELSRAGTERLSTYNERAAREFVAAWEAVLS